MTDLLVRTQDPRRTGTLPAPPASRPHWPLLGGVVAAAVAAAVGLAVVEVLVTVLALGDGRSDASLSEVLHVGAGIWLLAHGATLALPDGTVTLVPLGVTAFASFLLHRAGRTVARRVPDRGLRGVPAVAAAVALPYALLHVLVALVGGSSGGAVPSVLESGIGALVLAAAFAALGAGGILAPDRLAFLRRGGRVLRLSGPAPSPTRVVLRGALLACGVLAAGAALLAAVSLAAHLPTAADLAGETTGGMLSSTGVLVVQVALLPNLLVWFVSYAAGPGFVVGSATSVELFGGHLGEVPALPMFGGLPGTLPVPLVVAVLAVPVLAGLLAGRTVAGRLAAVRMRRVVLTAVAVGPVAGLLTALAVALASGQVLGGDLEHVGGSTWKTGLAVAVEVGLVAAVGAAVSSLLRRRRSRRRDVEGDAGAHRRAERPSGGRGRRLRLPGRPGWLHRPDRPGWLHRPGWLRRRPSVVELPD